MKTRTRMAALALAGLMIATALVVAPARSADTSNELFVDLAPGAPFNGYFFHDIAWTPDGNAALFVGVSGTGNPAAAWYYPGNNTWREGSPIGAPSITLYCVCWDPAFSRFIAAGQTTSSGYYFTAAPVGARMAMQSSGTLANCNLNDAVYREWDTGVWFCGRRTVSSTGPITFRIQGSGVALGPTGTGTYPAGEWFGIDVEYNDYAMYMVGRTGTGQSLVGSYVTGTSKYLAPSVQADFGDVVLDKSKVPYKLVISVGSRASGVKGVYTCPMAGLEMGASLDGWGNLPTANALYAISADASGVAPGTMVAVGYNGSYGFIYDVWTDDAGTLRVALRSPAAALLAAKQLKGVATRPSGQPYALVSGSAFKYSYTSAPSNVQVDTVIPHIAYVELYDAGTVTSNLNSQIDVDSGSGSLEYDLVVKAWSNAGQANIAQVDAYMWYDGGSNETFPWWGGAGYTTPGFENIRVMFRWLRGGGFSILYPGTGETTLDLAGCSAVDQPDLKNVTVTFRFCPRQQFRFADGPFGPEGPGSRYSFMPEGQTAAALNNLDSWNIQMTVWDVGASQANGYDEFGTYRYTYIGGAGLPGGGFMYGSGPPSTMIALVPDDQDVTFAANCPYQLTVEVTDLTGQMFGGTIQAIDLMVFGGMLTIWSTFPGPDMPLYLVGSAGPTYQNPLNTSVTTTTSTADYNPDLDPIMMRCNIPPVAEDRYIGVLTYRVAHE